MPSSQQPLGSGFTAWSTAADVIRGIDLSGKTAIVTGGYSNLGLETARVLAGAGAQVIIPARAPERARAAIATVKGAELEMLDLMDQRNNSAWSTGRSIPILPSVSGY